MSPKDSSDVIGPQEQQIGMTKEPNITRHYIKNRIFQHIQRKTTQVPPVVPTGFPFSYFYFDYFSKRVFFFFFLQNHMI